MTSQRSNTINHTNSTKKNLLSQRGNHQLQLEMLPRHAGIEGIGHHTTLFSLRCSTIALLWAEARSCWYSLRSSKRCQTGADELDRLKKKKKKREKGEKEKGTTWTEKGRNISMIRGGKINFWACHQQRGGIRKGGKNIVHDIMPGLRNVLVEDKKETHKSRKKQKPRRKDLETPRLHKRQQDQTAVLW